MWSRDSPFIVYLPNFEFAASTGKTSKNFTLAPDYSKRIFASLGCAI